MKFLLLKTLLLHKQKDEGFTLPIVMAIGLVMVLLSTVNLVQSGEENLNAISTASGSNAFAMAEIGVARYRDLLLNNRILAVRDLDEWTSFNDQTCDVISSTSNGWADNTATAWKNITLDEATVNLDLNSDGDMTDTNQLAGSYRLINYEYDQNPLDGDLDNDSNFDLLSDANNDSNGDNQSDARGFLTIQGRDRIGSLSQIRVEIPLGVNQLELNRLNPAIWIQQSSAAITNGTIGNVDIDSDGDGTSSELGDGTPLNPGDGNIVLYQPGTAVDGCNNPANLAGENTISDARQLPPLMNPATFTSTFITAPNTLKSRPISTPINTNIYTGAALGFDPSNFYNEKQDQSSGEFFGEIVLGTIYDETTGGANDPTGSLQAANSGVGVNGEDIFYYTTGAASLSIGERQAIIGDGNSKVILYVGGDLNINTGPRGVRLVNSTHISETQSPPYPPYPPNTPFAPPGIARYLEIHVAGNVNITGNGNVDITGLLRVGGTVNISSSSTVNVIGSIWANNWSANGAAINIDTDQTTVTVDVGSPPVSTPTTVSEFNFYTSTPERTPAPITYRPSAWETQEAD